MNGRSAVLSVRKLVPLLLCGLSLPLQAGWSDDWFASSTKSGPDSYRSQQRGYYSAGTFTARLNTTTDNLVTFSPPRVSAGCGGINMFMGGIAFMDEDYLVKKFEAIIQAAPAIAFDMALKVMAKELSNTMTTMEELTTFLNGLQMSDCQAAQRLTGAIASNIPAESSNAFSAKLKEFDTKVGSAAASTKNYFAQTEKQTLNDNQPTEDLKELIKDCPAEFKAAFAEGSLLANAGSLYGFTPYVDLMRGQLGDVIIQFSSSDKAPSAIRYPSCADQNAMSIDDFVSGKAKKQVLTSPGPGTECTDDTAGGMQKKVEDLMISIANKIKTKTAYTVEEENLIKHSPVPILPSLQDAVINGEENLTIGLTVDIIAYAYAFYLVDDLYRTIDQNLQKIEKLSDNTGGAGKQCDRSLYSDAIKKIMDLNENGRTNRTAAKNAYLKKLQEMMAHIEYAKVQQETHKMNLMKRLQESKP